MSHRSRGCLRCRQRRVKCDRGRPSCQRCIARSELCVGYRDEGDLMFQHETEKIVQRSQTASISTASTSSPPSRRTRSRSLERASESSFTSRTSLNLPSAFPWLKNPSSIKTLSDKDQAAGLFMDKYVLFPCNESSSPGFLQHLPCLFKEVNVEGRYALRWAVQACAFADLSREQSSEELVGRSLECYGRALNALGQSLAEKDKAPDDYDLMAVVILDIFESLFMPDSSLSGSHVQGMAHILRLRGHEQFHDTRGWGLFRLAHHRLQKQQLAKQLSPLPESHGWLEALNDDISSVRLEKDGLAITDLCQRANYLLQSLNSDVLTGDQLRGLVNEMLRLDKEAALWRAKPEWAFCTINRAGISGTKKKDIWFPETVQLHRDVWMAYEWNYHRTARIILHQKLVSCLRRASSLSFIQENSEFIRIQESIDMIQSLAGEVLSSVPQSFGDVDQLGRYWTDESKPPRWQAVGAYLLLWPIKIIKSTDGLATESQKASAQLVFDRIRECTGMKSELGHLSAI
ncbi:Zn(2)-C6 fungal-type domain-containing protein [Fusarium sp. LHS14.1]|nr:Zn(2)-C6 fungal-type domain-containing protein [Fusarium sp. LHS14.1]